MKRQKAVRQLMDIAVGLADGSGPGNAADPYPRGMAELITGFAGIPFYDGAAERTAAEIVTSAAMGNAPRTPLELETEAGVDYPGLCMPDAHVPSRIVCPNTLDWGDAVVDGRAGSGPTLPHLARVANAAARPYLTVETTNPDTGEVTTGQPEPRLVCGNTLSSIPDEALADVRSAVSAVKEAGLGNGDLVLAADALAASFSALDQSMIRGNTPGEWRQAAGDKDDGGPDLTFAQALTYGPLPYLSRYIPSHGGFMPLGEWQETERRASQSEAVAEFFATMKDRPGPGDMGLNPVMYRLLEDSITFCPYEDGDCDTDRCPEHLNHDGVHTYAQHHSPGYHQGKGPCACTQYTQPPFVVDADYGWTTDRALHEIGHGDAGTARYRSAVEHMHAALRAGSDSAEANRVAHILLGFAADREVS
jgi:hypothetical protein